MKLKIPTTVTAIFSLLDKDKREVHHDGGKDDSEIYSKSLSWLLPCADDLFCSGASEVILYANEEERKLVYKKTGDNAGDYSKYDNNIPFMNISYELDLDFHKDFKKGKEVEIDKKTIENFLGRIKIKNW